MTARARRRADVSMLCYGLGTIAVGAIGLAGHPSGRVEHVLGYWLAVYAFSGAFVIAGSLMVVGILAGKRTTSFWAVISVSLCTSIQGVVALFDGAAQLGIRLVIAPLMMIPLAVAWQRWHVRTLGDEHLSREVR